MEKDMETIFRLCHGLHFTLKEDAYAVNSLGNICNLLNKHFNFTNEIYKTDYREESEQ
jgi:hypothetical protein